MNMDIEQIIKLAIIILDCLVALLIVVNFIIGLIRGLDKSVHRLVVVTVCALGLFIFINPMTKLVSNFEVNPVSINNITSKFNVDLPEDLLEKDKVSIDEAVRETIVEYIYTDGAPETNKVETLVSDYSFIVIKLAVYVASLVFLLIAHVIVDIILSIIRKIMGIKLKRRKRLLGGLVYIARYAVFFVVVLLPIYGILSLGLTLSNEVIQYKDEIQLDENTSNMLVSYNECVENSVVRKVVFKPLTAVFASEYKDEATIDAVYVGNALSTTTSDGLKVKLYDEFHELKKVIPAVMKTMGMVQDDTAQEKLIDLSKFEDSDIDGVVDALKNSKLIPSAIPALIEYAIYNAEKEENTSTVNVLKALQTVNWEKEFANLAEVFSVIKEHKEVVIDLNDPQGLITNKKVISLVRGVLEKVVSLESVKTVAIPLVVDVLVAKLDENGDMGINAQLLKEIDWAEEVTPICDALEKIADAYVELEITTLDKTVLGKVINKENITNTIKGIMDVIMDSQVVKEVLLPVLCEKLPELIPSKEAINIDLSFVTAIFTEQNIIDLFTKEENINITVNVLKTVNDLGLFEDGSTLDLNDTATIETLADTAKNIFNYTVLSDNETKSNIFKSLIEVAGVNTATEKLGVSLNFDNVTNWNNEIDNIFEIVKDVLKLTDKLDSFDFSALLTVDQTLTAEEQLARKNTICDIVERLAGSEIFGDSILSLINGLSTQISADYQITIDQADKAAIEAVGGTGWHTEVMTILNIVEDAKDLLSIQDYSQLPAETIRDIMKEASNGVIATKIFGTVLNKLLNGKISTDFTVRANMLSCSDLVYNLLSIASFATLDLSDPANTAALVANISNLANNEEVLDTLTEVASEVLGDALPDDLDKETIQEAAQVISDVMDEYQKLSEAEQENFSVDDLPQSLQDKIEESGGDANEFASLIFSYLFN